MIRLRVGLVCDYREERWPSMDLVADMLGEALPGEGLDVERLQPSLRRRLTRCSLLRERWPAPVVDCLAGRFLDYPRWLRARAGGFDVLHIVDHSYAHLARVLPADRVVVTCHDLEVFEPLLAESASRKARDRVGKRGAAGRADDDDAAAGREGRTDGRRGAWMGTRRWRARLLAPAARRVLEGLQQAARVVCVSRAVRDELLAVGLVPAEKLAVVPNGVHPAFSSDPNVEADAQAERLLGPRRASDVELLHVGSATPRKRIDRLLAVAAAARSEHPSLRLVRVGGALGSAHRRLARDLGVAGRLVELPWLEPRVLAAVYRRASALLLPSDVEGFGLPVLEALACGTPVIASALPALQETGGAAAEYCPPDDIAGWVATLGRVLAERRDPLAAGARRERGLARARELTWPATARGYARVYEEIAGSAAAPRAARPEPSLVSVSSHAGL
jgi:glycosyltransferase involved in cell wall biosynthesis